ncbi:MAG: argininosuccinate lyase [Candidatus Margulisiibacteriota bacterium]|jgi:argininosuccinate lyase
MANKKMWGGRFTEATSKLTETFTSSIHYDDRLFKYDIRQNIAYATSLQKAKVFTAPETKKVIQALNVILKEFEHGKINLRKELEDVHMNIEMLLVEKVGDIGKKLHSGRSRNDQVATDFRLYVKDKAEEIIDLISALQSEIVDVAEKNIKIIMPGYTHLQRAQPILFSHHLMSYYEMLCRDKKRFNLAKEEADVMPLGSGALSGNAFGIDRDALAEELGFSDVSKNSIDAVSDRDFAIEFLSACSILMVHISRMSEELIIWSTFEFNFVEMSDKFTTGSSIMPQKKNPDVAELSRGKSGRVFGHLMSLLVMMKGLPLAYNRDMQEDKEMVFDAADTLTTILTIYAEMIATLKINGDKMAAAAKKGFLTATDLAYYLVRRNVPFREAHEIVGKIVSYCEQNNMQLEYLSLKQLKEFSEFFTYDVTRVLSAESSIASRDIIGGTASNRVKEAIKRARKDLLHDKA